MSITSKDQEVYLTGSELFNIHRLVCEDIAALKKEFPITYSEFLTYSILMQLKEKLEKLP